MAAKTNINSASLLSGWVSEESGRSRTRSRDIIAWALDRLKKKRTLITLYHKDYESGSTVLVDFDKQLLIDKPPNWPGNISSINVRYKDGEKLWNFFHVAVRSSDKDFVYAELPGELVQLQRRDNYRVDVPGGSRIDFSHAGKAYTVKYIENISAGGILIRMKGAVLKPGDELENGGITLPQGQGKADDDAQPLIISLKKAEVVRAFRYTDHIHVCFGISFFLSSVEEDKLHQYIRRRELEILQKGISMKGS